jgi:hypothetical protein
MPGNNISMLSMTGTADAIGNRTATDAATSTLVMPGTAVGFAGASAVAQGTSPAGFYADADTYGFINGSEPTGGRNNHVSIDFLYGPSPVTYEAAISFVGAHGGGRAFSDHSLDSFSYPTLHGLF